MNPKMYFWFLWVIFLFAFYQAVYLLIHPKIGWIGKFIAGLVIVYVIVLGFQRNTYLPFLGPTVVPGTLFPESLKPKDANLQFALPIEEANDTKVIYWASQSAEKPFEDPWLAYGEFQNVGVTSVQNNIAIVSVVCPSSYYVPTQLLKPHIHYRVVQANGMLGEVKTAYVSCHEPVL